MTVSSNAQTHRRTFSPADLQTLTALQQHPRRAGWKFNLDHDETWDLISVQPPSVGRSFPATASAARLDTFLIIPAATPPGGVLMSINGLGEEEAYPSLADALANVGPAKVSWRRALGDPKSA